MHPARELVFGDEDAGEEVERQEQGVDDRGGGVLGGDRRGQRDAEAAERGGAEDQRHQDRRQPLQGIGTAVEEPPITASSASMITATTIELPTRPAMKTQGGIGVPRPRFSRPSFAGDHQRHRQGLHRRGDDREGDDRRHVVGGRLDPAPHVHGLAAEGERRG